MTEALVKQLPHRRMEAWKWTDVSRVVDKQSGLSFSLTPKVEAPEGVDIGLAKIPSQSDAPMAAMAAQVSEQSLTIGLAEGFEAKEPIILSEMSRGHGRVLLFMGAGSSATLIEHHRGQDKGFVNLDLQIHLSAGAKLTRIIMQDDPETMVRIATACVAAEKEAELKQYTLSFGGALCRLETRLYGEGEDIEAHINGAYLLSDKRHCDMTSHIDLKHPDCTIRQSIKGVVMDGSRGVFQGKFHVHKDAQHTDAEMRHDALMLSDKAEVRAKPELEIYADDVACAHGNTIGALDDSALFYMRQRGIPEAQARVMLTEAFLSEVFDDLDNDEMRKSILGKVGTWLIKRA